MFPVPLSYATVLVLSRMVFSRFLALTTVLLEATPRGWQDTLILHWESMDIISQGGARSVQL